MHQGLRQDCPTWNNLYTGRQLTTNAIHLLLMTGSYFCPFKEWDHMAPEDQTWIVLCTLIQEVFQCCLNTTAPTASHHRYTPAMMHHQNTIGALAIADSEDDMEDTIATQVAALTYQRQLLCQLQQT
jgi:hypothetical protein